MILPQKPTVFAPTTTILASNPLPPKVVDAAIAQSLVETLQLFIVSDLIEDTVKAPEYAGVNPFIGNSYGTPYLTEIEETINIITDPESGYTKISPILQESITYSEIDYPIYQNLGCKCKPKSTELILPPLASQLPYGLGYLPAAVPLVMEAYGAIESAISPLGSVVEAVIPGSIPLVEPVITFGSTILPGPGCMSMTAPCTCASLATPMPPALAMLAQPVIL